MDARHHQEHQPERTDKDQRRQIYGFAQVDNAFDNGQYAVINLLHYPVLKVMIGGELQTVRRENFNDGW